MAESVDALVSNTSGATHPGSSPGPGTQKGEHHHYDALLFFIPARSGTPPYSAPVISMLARYPAPVPLVLLLKKTKKSASIGITGFLRIFCVVLPGFEPRQAEPKTAVLPLHHKTILFAQAHKEPKAPQS